MYYGKIVAIKHLNFKDRETGKPVVGDKIYITVPAQFSGWSDNVELVDCFVAEGDPRNILDGLVLSVGFDVVVEFGRCDRIVRISLCGC